jgi:hypothetical protein
MVMFNYLAGILFSSNLLDNFDGMDVFVVTVNVTAIVFMFIAACWVWKFAPDLSQKLGVSPDLVVPTVLSKLTHSISHRFSVVNVRDIELQAANTSTATPTATTTTTANSGTGTDVTTIGLPVRVHSDSHEV